MQICGVSLNIVLVEKKDHKVKSLYDFKDLNRLTQKD
jgi:hypothetical protein